jgi:hypothetical protein
VSGSQTLTFSDHGAEGGHWLAMMLYANCRSPPKNWLSMLGDPSGVHGSELSDSGLRSGSGSSLLLLLPSGRSIGPLGNAYLRGDIGVFGSSGPSWVSSTELLKVDI